MATNFINDLLNNYNNANDDGRKGKKAEGLFKILCDNIRGRVVSLPGRVDTRKKLNNGQWADFEVKTGHGELGVLDAEGNIVKTCLTSDYMVYCYKYNEKGTLDEMLDSFAENAYVFPMATFIDLLNKYNLIYKKKSSAMGKVEKERQYNDRLGIQQFETERRRKVKEGFLNDLEAEGIPVMTFIEENLR